MRWSIPTPVTAPPSRNAGSGLRDALPTTGTGAIRADRDRE